MFTLYYCWCAYICVWKLVKEPYFVLHCVNNPEWWWCEDQKVFYHVLHSCETFQGRCKLFRKWINPKSLSLIELHPWLFTQRYEIDYWRKKFQSENFANLQKLEVKNSPANIATVHIFTNIYFFRHPYSYSTVWIMKIRYGVMAHITHFRFLPISPIIFATVQKFALDYFRDQQILTPPCEWGWVLVVPLLGKTLEVEDSPGMVWGEYF